MRNLTKAWMDKDTGLYLAIEKRGVLGRDHFTWTDKLEKAFLAPSMNFVPRDIRSELVPMRVVERRTVRLETQEDVDETSSNERLSRENGELRRQLKLCYRSAQTIIENSEG